MIKFLIITQDLRVSGTSQGILERSFLCKLRKSYPDSIIDVHYLKAHKSEDQLDLLPVDNISEIQLNLKVPFLIRWINKFYWRVFDESLHEKYIHQIYSSQISKISYEIYDCIFIRTSGVNCETILGSQSLPILKKAYITFNEPYPSFWCSGNTTPISDLHLLKIKKMLTIVEQSKGCVSTKFLGKDMQFLYGSRKRFFELPHEFDEDSFDFKNISNHFLKQKKVTISYHGAIQFGRDLDQLLDAYRDLVLGNEYIAEHTEFFVRAKSSEVNRIKEKFKKIKNIYILEGVDFPTSYVEQKEVSDINISLENGPIYCSVLLGKAPVLDFINKRILSLSPFRSEMREHITNDKYVATYNNGDEIKSKLLLLINEVLDGKEFKDKIFGNYFSDKNFKEMLDKVLMDGKTGYIN